MSSAIVLAGGELILMESMDESSLRESSSIDENTCVMWCDPGASQSTQTGGSGIVKLMQQLLARSVFTLFYVCFVPFFLFHCTIQV